MTPIFVMMTGKKVTVSDQFKISGERLGGVKGKKGGEVDSATEEVFAHSELSLFLSPFLFPDFFFFVFRP